MKADRENNKAIMIGLIAVAAIAVIVLIIAIVMTVKSSKQLSSDVTTTLPAQVVSENTVTNQIIESTTGAVIDGNITTSPSADAQTTQPGQVVTQRPQTNPSPSQMSSAQIVSNMMSAVAQVKSNAAFSGRKIQKINIQMVDCSISSIVGLANKIIQKLAGDTDKSFKFSGGKGTDIESGETDSVANIIPPSNKSFIIDVNGLASATAEQNGANTIYTVKFKQEKTTLASPVPYYHSMAMDYLDLASIDVSPAKVTQADFTYTGATVKVTVDGNGKIIGFYEYMPITGTGSGSLGLSASATIEGFLEESWTFTW